MLTLTSVSVMSRDRSLIAEYFMHGAPARSAGARHGDSASCSAAVVATNGKIEMMVRMPIRAGDRQTDIAERRCLGL